MMNFVGLDIGTTSIRAFAFNEDGELVSSSSHTLPVSYPAPGRAEQDPRQILRLSVQTLDDLAKQLPEPPTSLGIANQRETVTAWNRKTLDPISPAISWQDRRGEANCEELKLQGTEEVIRNATGLTLDPYFSATKYSQIASSLDRIRGKDVSMGTLDSWILANLTQRNAPLTDYTNASRTSLFDIGTCQYSQTLGDLFQVPLDMLPEPIASNALFGEIAHPDLREWRGVPIHGVLGDQQASLLGLGCTEFGETKATLGTGTFVLANIGSRADLRVPGIITSIAWNFADKGSTYCLEGSIFSTASLLQWLTDVMGIAERTENLSSIASSVRSSEQVTIIPFFAGSGAPWWNESASAVLGGLDSSTSKAHIARAAYESIALQLSEVTKRIADSLGPTVDSLKLDGGLSNLDLLCQLIADQANLQCDASLTAESTAFGAAMVAATGLGAVKVEQIKAKVQTRKSFQPSQNRMASRTRAERWNNYLGKLGLAAE